MRNEREWWRLTAKYGPVAYAKAPFRKPSPENDQFSCFSAGGFEPELRHFAFETRQKLERFLAVNKEATECSSPM